MADILLFSNNAQSTLASPLTTLSTTCSVLPGAGAKFPNPAASGQIFKMTFVDQATKAINEIVTVTHRDGDTMTIVRGQEGTTPQSWLAGDIAAMLPTAGTMQQFSQVPQTQAGASNYAQDIGSVNSLSAVLSPPVTTNIPGLTVRIKAANSNTGASTLNIGAGSKPLVNPDGSALGTGAIIANGIIEIADDGVQYQLISSSQQAQSLSGAATTGDFSWRPTSEIKTGWVKANATTIGNASSNATQRANADCANLFAWHWNNFSNTQCPVFTSAGAPTTRGANAAADFAANKQIRVIDARGIAMLGMDTMGGSGTSFYSGVPAVFGNSATPGSIIGETLHSLSANENGAHVHTNSLFDPSHDHPFNFATPIAGTNHASLRSDSGTNDAPISPFTLDLVSNTTGITISNSSSGSGSGHNTVDRGMVGTIYIKL